MTMLTVNTALFVALVALTRWSSHALVPSTTFVSRRISNQPRVSSSSLSMVYETSKDAMVWPSEVVVDTVPLSSSSSSSSALVDASTAATESTAAIPPLPTVPAPSWLGNGPWMGRLLVLTAAAIYGTNFYQVKLLGQVLPTGCSAVARFGLAAVVVAVSVWISEQGAQQPATPQLQEERNQATIQGMEIGAWYAVGYMMQSIGLLTVDANKSAFFNALAVVVVPLLDVALKNKKLHKNMVGAIALAMVGVALLQLGPLVMALQDHTALVHGAATVTRGDWLCFAQALFFGIGYWRLEAAANQFPDQAPRMTAGQLVGVALGAIVYCVWQGQVPGLTLLSIWASDPFIIQSILWTGLVSTALALYLETLALKTISATELTILMTSVSVWGSAFAFVFMDEVLSPIGMVGGLLIMSSCLLSATSNEEEEFPKLLEQEEAFIVDAALVNAVAQELHQRSSGTTMTENSDDRHDTVGSIF